MEENKSVFKKIGKWLLIFIGILLLSFIFACLFYIIYLIRTGEWQSQQPLTSTKPADVKVLQQMTKDSYWLGSATPKVTIIEFGDFACLHCQESFSTLREISIKYKNSVKIIFKDFPAISEYSPTLAEAARCAGEQGLFWPMYDKLYLSQDSLAQETDITKLKIDLIELAKEISADSQRFTNCLNSNKYQTNIGQDYQDGEALQINGTPTWFINGYKIAGAIPHDDFINIIEQYLK